MTLRFDVIPVHLALEFSTRASVIDAANDGSYRLTCGLAARGLGF